MPPVKCKNSPCNADNILCMSYNAFDNEILFISFHFCCVKCSLLCDFMLQLSNKGRAGFITGIPSLVHFVDHEGEEIGLETTIPA